MAEIARNDVAVALTAATSVAWTPPDGGADSRIALQVTVSTTSGSPTITYKLQGSLDGTNYCDIALLPNDSSTTAASFTKAVAPNTYVYFVDQQHSRKFESYQFVSSSVTTTTYSASLFVLR